MPSKLWHPKLCPSGVAVGAGVLVGDGVKVVVGVLLGVGVKVEVWAGSGVLVTGGLRLQDVIDQLAPDGGLPNSPDNFTGYIIWLSQWHGVAPTAWLYFTATGEPFKITPPVLHAQPYRNYFTTSTPTLTWGRIAWAQEYEIQVDSSPSFTIPLSFTTTVPAVDASTQATHLVDGVYYWRIRAKAGTRIGGWSVADSFVIDTP